MDSYGLEVVVLFFGFLYLVRQFVRHYPLRGIPQVSLAAVQEALSDSKVIILDVRTAEEYQICHIPGTISLPLTELAEQIEKIPRDRPVYVICYSSARSLQAVKFLLSQGYTQVCNVSEGMKKWQGPVIKTQEN